MDITTSLIPTITLDPGNLENLVGKRSSDLVGSSDISVFWQLPEDPGEIKAGIAMSKLEQYLIKDVARKLLRFVSKQCRSIFMIRLQGVNETLEELG